MKRARTDKDVAAAVNRGLAAALLVGIHAGIRVMTDGGVPPEVMSRVLLAPHSRRGSDWKR